MLPVLFLALFSQNADAKSKGPYMWGVGPTFNTIAYPGRFPPALPKDTRDDIAKAKDDLAFGLRGVLYMDKEWRGAARLNFGRGLGSNANEYKSTNFTFEADKILTGQSGGYAFAGGGIGFGTMHFGNDNVSDVDLSLSTYLFRGQLGAYYRMKTSAVELNLFATFVWPGVQEFASGTKTKEVTGGNYLHGGIEATMYFGDFTPPRKKKKNKKKK